MAFPGSRTHGRLDMTAVVATALGVVAVALVVLGYAVWRLRSQVDMLSQQLLSPSPMPTISRVDRHGSSPAADRVERPSGRPTEVPPDQVEPVVSITDISDISDDRTDEPAVSRVVSVTLAGPLIKVAALSHGVRRALDEESRMRIGYAVRRELKRQRKLRRRQSMRRTAGQGLRP